VQRRDGLGLRGVDRRGEQEAAHQQRRQPLQLRPRVNAGGLHDAGAWNAGVFKGYGMVGEQANIASQKCWYQQHSTDRWRI
jgi:hypothetical protein